MYFYICKNTTIKIQQCYILPTYTFLATGLLFGITHPTLTVQYPGASTEHRRTLPKVEITGKSLTIPEHNSASGRGGRPCFHFSFQQPPRGLNTLPVGKPRPCQRVERERGWLCLWEGGSAGCWPTPQHRRKATARSHR